MKIEFTRQPVRIVAHQDTINAALRESIQALARLTTRHVEIQEDVKTTLARIETLLARMLRHADNGREA